MTDFDQPLPMLRYVLAWAIDLVRDPNQPSLRLPSVAAINYGSTEPSIWVHGVKEACFGILGKNLLETDRIVVLIRSAARMLVQSGTIQWDQPENEVQREQEQRWLDALADQKVEEEKKAMTKRNLHQKRAPLILTEAQKQELRSGKLISDHLVGRRAKETAWRNLPLYMDKTFNIEHLNGRYSDWDYAVVFNKLIETGIIDLVKLADGWREQNAQYAQYQLGPCFLAYMKRWHMVPKGTTKGTWPALVEALNQRWGTSYKPEDFPQ